MATINTKKETALKRIQSKLNEGYTLKSKINASSTQEHIYELTEIFDTWKTSTANGLRQIFSDSHLSEEFSKTDNVSNSTEASGDEQITELKKNITRKIKILENILSDLNDGLYYVQEDPNIKTAKLGLWQAIIIALITALAGIVTGYLTSDRKPTTESERQIGNLTLEGSWKYICTSFDGMYQHGGRFKVQKDKGGFLHLVGERTWRDTYDSISKNWINKDYNESDYLQWHTNWIYVKASSTMYFEYEIPTSKGNILGYCSGGITLLDGKVDYVKGNFYVLNAEEILKGQIIFRKVSDEDFNLKQTLPKNH